MKKKLVYLPVFILAALTVALIPSEKAQAAYSGPWPWTGSPDPYQCNFYLDCNWTVDVCITGTTYEVGIYFDPVLHPETIPSAESAYDQKVGACPMMNPLIDMYVYYCANPFFGDTNTLTIFSSQGAPSAETVLAYAGGKMPEGCNYSTALACSGTLYDDGSDKGVFSCDSFLSGLGERRANLHDDVEGPDFDLWPKIQEYLHLWPMPVIKTPTPIINT